MISELGRVIRRSRAHMPVSAAVCVTIAVGVTANVLIFSVFDRLYLRPLDVPHAQRLILITGATVDTGIDRLQWFGGARSIEALAEYYVGGSTVTAGSRSERVSAAVISSTLMSLLGERVERGRDLAAFDENSASNAVVLVGHTLALDLFGLEDPIGRALNIDGVSTTVVGVTRAQFTFPGNTDIWLPRLATGTQRRLGTDVQSGLVLLGGLIARLRSNVDVNIARQELRSLQQQLETRDTAGRHHPRGHSNVSVTPLRDRLVAQVRPTIVIVVLASVSILVVTITNVAVLLLAHTVFRQRDVAVRVALGASTRRIAVELLSDVFLLAILGVALSTGLTLFGLGISRNLAGDAIQSLGSITFDARTALATVVIGLSVAGCAAIPSLVAAVRQCACNYNNNSTSYRLTLDGLLALEVGTTLVVLMISLKTVSAMSQALETNRGFETNRRISFEISLPRTLDQNQRVTHLEHLMTRFKQLNGVTAVAVTNQLPLSGRIVRQQSVRAETMGDELMAVAREISPGFFESMGIPFISGRDFSGFDTADKPHVVAVDRRLAERVWPNINPLGRRLQVQMTWHVVVGVVGSVADSLSETGSDGQLYFPLSQAEETSNSDTLTVVIRGVANAADVAATIRSIIRDEGLAISLARFDTLGGVVWRALSAERIRARVVTAMSVVALILTAAGVFATFWYRVAQSTSEIGIRIALGAQRGNVAVLVLKRVVLIGAVGIGCGVIVRLMAGQFLRATVLGAVGDDGQALFWAISYVVVMMGLGAVAPTWRATHIDPWIAIRQFTDGVTRTT